MIPSSSTIPWTWSGPINTALRIVNTGPGHAAYLNVTYSPTSATQHAIAGATSAQIASSLQAVAADGPATTRYRRLLAEVARAEAKETATALRVARLRRQQDSIGDDGVSGLGQRLRRIATQLNAALARQAELVQEAIMLREVQARARQAAEQELAAAFGRQRYLAQTLLDETRRALERDLADKIGERITALIAVDAAALRLRSGGTLQNVETSRMLDSLSPLEEANSDVGSDDENLDDEAQVDEDADDSGLSGSGGVTNVPEARNQFQAGDKSPRESDNAVGVSAR